MFHVINSIFNLSSAQLSSEINNSFIYFESLLGKAKINYTDLRKVLVPSIDKKEICFVFDTLYIKECSYGIKILNDLLPFFNKQKKYNVLFGDLLDYSNYKFTDKILDIMCAACNINRVDEHKFTNRYFLIYINNLSKSDFQKFANCVSSRPYFVGYADMTYSSLFKSYISNCISSQFILLNNKVICKHEPDIEDIASINIIGCDFEHNGFEIVSVSSDYYSLFLDYLIDSSVSVWEKDNAYKELMSDIISYECDLNDFLFNIPDEKIMYLIHHSNIQLRLGNPNNVKETIQNMVSHCIKNNIFYELDFNKLQYEIIKFNVFIDVSNSTKLTCSIKYNILQKSFELITMY